MRILLLILMLPAAIRASGDPLLARLSQPMKKGSWEFNLGISQYTRDLWMDAQGKEVLYLGEYSGIVDKDGIQKSVKGFRFEFCTQWQAGQHSLLELSVPYYYQEFSLDTADPALDYTAKLLDDATVRRGDGLGDINFILRQVLFNFERGRVGANIELSAPTGQSFFAAAHGLVANGSGSFGGALALELEGHKGGWGGWLQGRMPFDFGANQDIGTGLFLGYQEGTTTPKFFPSGPAFVRRDPGIEADLGLAWIWAESETYRHRLIIEVNAKSEGALVVGDTRVMETARQSLTLVPQASFNYLHSINLTFGWQLYPLWATNQAVSNWGEFLIRADYQL